MSLRVTDRAVVSQTGNVRRTNEDSHLIREPLFMVADGMGGAQAGEVASRMAADEFAGMDVAAGDGEATLRHVITRANQRIVERGRSDPSAAGMGTTVTAALVAADGRIAFANVGDSRAYLLRAGTLQRLSEDHSLVGELMRAGQLSEAEAEHHPQRNVVTRVLGAEPDVEVDTFTLQGEPGDVVLLCTDGLNTMIDDATIGRIMADGRSAEATARELVRAALAAGGEDNVTALVFRLDPGDEPAAAVAPDAAAAPAAEDGETARTGRLPSIGMAVRVALALIVAGALAVGAVVGLRWSHFVGADQTAGRVAVYQGLPVELPFGVRLYRETYLSPLVYATLPAAERRRLFDHRLRSSADALRAVRTVEATAP
jgi:PPM family protein phosphatase